MVAILIIHFLGIIVASCVFKNRAGVPMLSRFRIFGKKGFGLGWALTMGGKSMVWPVVLIVWLANGRPEPKVVFNEKAELIADRTRSRA
jgi:hypothetical protein